MTKKFVVAAKEKKKTKCTGRISGVYLEQLAQLEKDIFYTRAVLVIMLVGLLIINILIGG